ncbi:MAG: hypothetical protein FJ224_11655 [Lentisphaerae bacterium]|nr:hypothetical protein [Lentisphaerota bacterium]
MTHKVAAKIPFITVAAALAVAAAGCRLPEVRAFPESSAARPPVFETGAEPRSATSPAPEKTQANPEQPAGLSSTPVAPAAVAASRQDLTISTGPELPKVMIKDMNLAADTDVTVVLRALAKAGSQNMLISKNVKGPVNFSFNQVRWDEAFKGVLAAASLSYSWEGDIIRVMTLDDMKQELEIEKMRHERRTVESERLKAEPMVLRIVKVRYMSAKKLSETLKALWGQESAKVDAWRRASVTVDEDNNTIVIHAIETEAAKISSLISELDRPKKRSFRVCGGISH